MLTPKEFATKYKLQEKDFSYAQAETWVVADASTALSYLMSVARQEMYMAEQSDSREVVALMRDLSNFITAQIDEMDDALASTDMVMYKDAQSQLLTTKDQDGKYRWTLFTGSAFEDKDGEIISTKAFEDDCDQMELTQGYGELLWWHCDGTQHATDKEARPYLPLGQCDISLVSDKINIESGLYYDDSIGEYFSTHTKEFGASKSFWHKEQEPVEGVYTYIRTKERSILPRTKEANLLTRLFGQKEKEMADNKDRIAALKEKLGEEKTNDLLAQGKAMSEKAESFLKSKEAKTEEKKEEVKVEGLTELTETFTNTLKESNEKLVLALKEQGETFTKELTTFKELQTKELDALKTDLAQTQGAVAILLGLQPKNKNKFVASEEKETKIELTESQKTKAKEVEGFGGDVASWIITGERQVAA